MKKIITNIKDFWKKGKMQKAIIIGVPIILIALIFGLTNQEKEIDIHLTISLDKKEANIGDVIEYDLDLEPVDLDTDEYDYYIHYDKSIVEYNDSKKNFKAIGGGEAEIYATLSKDDKEFKSNIVKLNVKENYVSITAAYNGSTTSGTMVNSKSSIVVTATSETGVENKVSGWEVTNPSALVAEETSNYTITFKGLTCDLSVTCTSMKPMSTGQSNALKKAKSYLSFSSFSRSGLISQLEYEGFSTDDSTFAVDKCNVDWNEQAAKKAKSYLSFSSFSRNGLIGQLKYEGFTQEQAEYGVSAVGY